MIKHNPGPMADAAVASILKVIKVLNRSERLWAVGIAMAIALEPLEKEDRDDVMSAFMSALPSLCDKIAAARAALEETKQ